MSSNSLDKEVDAGLREQLAEIGRGAERAMFKATHGANTHKGAIWTLGLLVGAAARRVGQSAQEIATVAGAIARLPDRAQPQHITHGDLMRDRYRVAGARGEASNGFPHVIQFGLPTLRRQRAEKSPEEICRLDALLSLMSQVDDTCVLYRGGSEGLSFVKSGAQTVLMAGGYGSFSGRKLVRELDRELIERGISPGGSADLLAATIFLDAVEHQQSEIGNGRSK
jgi:triphosphoribosyl-dephospho-CoA synthase